MDTGAALVECIVAPARFGTNHDFLVHVSDPARKLNISAARNTVELVPQYHVIEMQREPAAQIPSDLLKNVKEGIDDAKRIVRDGTSADSVVRSHIQPKISEIALKYDMHRAGLGEYPHDSLSIANFAADIDDRNFSPVVRQLIDQFDGFNPQRLGPMRLEDLALRAYVHASHSSYALTVMKNGIPDTYGYSRGSCSADVLKKLYLQIKCIIPRRDTSSLTQYSPESKEIYREALQLLHRNDHQADGRAVVTSAFIDQANAQQNAEMLDAFKYGKNALRSAAVTGGCSAATTGLAWLSILQGARFGQFDACLVKALAPCPIVPVTMTSTGPDQACAEAASHVCEAATHGDFTFMRASAMTGATLGSFGTAIGAASAAFCFVRSYVVDAKDAYCMSIALRAIAKALERLPVSTEPR